MVTTVTAVTIPPFLHQEMVKLLYRIFAHRVKWEKIGWFPGVYRQ
jgi:hypothetical protein